jgi:hypothetical protein
MAQVEITFGGKPVRVELAPSDNYPDTPHKVLTVTDAESGQMYVMPNIMRNIVLKEAAWLKSRRTTIQKTDSTNTQIVFLSLMGVLYWQ